MKPGHTVPFTQSQLRFTMDAEQVSSDGPAVIPGLKPGLFICSRPCKKLENKTRSEGLICYSRSTLTCRTVQQLRSNIITDLELLLPLCFNCVWQRLTSGCTLEQRFLDPTLIQPSGHWGGDWVGGAAVKTAPFARCLQMYFELLVQGSTSQSPAKIPVVMAVQPWMLPWVVWGGKRNSQM